MSLLPRIRAELAGAWRSVGYDLGRRPAPPVSVSGPDVTSTGMNTFPGSLVNLPMGPPETDARPPRRFVAVTAFCALAAIGAGGSYVAATTVFAGEPAAVTQAAPGPDHAKGGLVSPTSGHRKASGRTVAKDAMGPVPVATKAGRPRTGAPSTAKPARKAPVAVRPAPGAPAGRRTAGTPARPARSATPECACLTPPVTRP